MWLKRHTAPQPAAELAPDPIARLEATAANLWALIQGGAEFPGFTTSFDGTRASLRRDHTPSTGNQVSVRTDEGGMWRIEEQSWAPGLEEGGQGLVVRETVDRPISAVDPVLYTRDAVELRADGAHANVMVIPREVLDAGMRPPTDLHTAARIAATLGSVIDIARVG